MSAGADFCLSACDIRRADRQHGDGQSARGILAGICDQFGASNAAAKSSAKTGFFKRLQATGWT
jgi:hypothetical protein